MERTSYLLSWCLSSGRSHWRRKFHWWQIFFLTLVTSLFTLIQIISLSFWRILDIKITIYNHALILDCTLLFFSDNAVDNSEYFSLNLFDGSGGCGSVGGVDVDSSGGSGGTPPSTTDYLSDGDNPTGLPHRCGLKTRMFRCTIFQTDGVLLSRLFFGHSLKKLKVKKLTLKLKKLKNFLPKTQNSGKILDM